MGRKRDMFLRFSSDFSAHIDLSKANLFLFNQFPLSAPNVFPKKQFPVISRPPESGLIELDYFESLATRDQLRTERQAQINKKTQRRLCGCTGHHNMRRKELCED
jgi:hypothetical protein